MNPKLFLLLFKDNSSKKIARKSNHIYVNSKFRHWNWKRNFSKSLNRTRIDNPPTKTKKVSQIYFLVDAFPASKKSMGFHRNNFFSGFLRLWLKKMQRFSIKMTKGAKEKKIQVENIPLLYFFTQNKPLLMYCAKKIFRERKLGNERMKEGQRKSSRFPSNYDLLESEMLEFSQWVLKDKRFIIVKSFARERLTVRMDSSGQPWTFPAPLSSHSTHWQDKTNQIYATQPSHTKHKA